MEEKSNNLDTDNSNKPLYEANDLKLIANDVTFSSDPVCEKAPVVMKRKRARQNESKRKIDEEEEKELDEQRYERLIHLLNKSQFYTKYLTDKVKETLHAQKENRAKKEHNEDSIANGKVVRGDKQNKGKEQYDIAKYLTIKDGKKLVNNRKKLNLSNEEIEEELCKEVESEMSLSDFTNIPKFFVGSLRNYQMEGLQWLKLLYENGINGILADEMGLGKTIQIIALLCHLIEKHQNGPYLIVAPLSTVPNWTIEFKRFAPLLPVVVFHGNKSERVPIYSKIKRTYNVDKKYRTRPIVITSFEIPLLEKQFLMSQKWRYIIVDEGHRLKNKDCILVNVLKSLTSMNRLILTGTPLQNNLCELWSLLNFLLPEIFDDLAIFESWFNANEVQHDEGAKKFLKQEEEKRVICLLREILNPFMLRREKSDVCVEIPPKKEVIVYAPITQLQYDLYTAVLNYDLDTLRKVKCEEDEILPTVDGKRPKRKCYLKSKYGGKENYLERSYSSLYSAIEEEENNIDSDNWQTVNANKNEKNLAIWKEYTEVTESNIHFFIRLTMSSRLMMYRKIINHPYLIHCPLDAVGLPKIDNNIITSSGKLLVLDALLTKLKSRGHKVLLFSTMTMMLDILEDYLLLRNYKYARLDGKMKIDKRSKNIETFNSDSDVFIFLISTRAGGVGLNLIGADTVIIYDSDWNPQADLQAMARCHRIGQTRPVVIYRLCTKGTVDERIITRANAKRILEKMVISNELRETFVLNKNTLLEMKRLMDSKEYQVVEPDRAVFTEAELEQLLDRTDMHKNKTSG